MCSIDVDREPEDGEIEAQEHSPFFRKLHEIRKDKGNRHDYDAGFVPVIDPDSNDPYQD
jgi:hypothetical protein